MIKNKKESQDILHRKWIEIKIGLSATMTLVAEIKDMLEGFQYELEEKSSAFLKEIKGISQKKISEEKEFENWANNKPKYWEVVIDKNVTRDEDGNKLHTIALVPKERKISPEEFGFLYKKLISFTQELYQSLHPITLTNEKGEAVGESSLTSDEVTTTPFNFLEAKKIDDIECENGIADYLIVNYFLKDRLELEKEDMGLAKIIFNGTFEEYAKSLSLKTGFFNNFFQDKETIEYKDKFKQRLKDWFGIVIK
jgi:hypothetical protein